MEQGFALSSVPEAAKFVGVEDGVVADDGKVFGLGLCDEHAVEGILVGSGEQSGAGGVGGGDGKRFKGFLSKNRVETEGEVGGLGQLTDARFRGDFPGGSGADENAIGTGADESACGGRKRRIIGEPPEQGVSVQEEAQKSLPGFEFGIRQGLEEFGADVELSLHAARLALALFLAQGLEANERLVATSDDDFLAFAGLFDEAREVGLGMMDLDGGHVS